MRFIQLLSMRWGKAAVCMLFLVGGTAAVEEVRGELVRGPYLQSASQTGITICWETEEAQGAVVRLMDERGRELRRLRAEPPAERHELRVEGLQAAERYRYELLLGGEAAAEGSFSTAARPGTPIRFAIWGDSRSNPATCGRIASLILESGVSMSVHSGDIVGRGSNLHEWNQMFFDPCRDMLRSVVFWPAIGNHDQSYVPEIELHGPYTDVFALPGEERYYSFEYGDAYFLVLDSNSRTWNCDEQYAFAERELAQARAPWRFVMLHHPLFTSGSHASHVRMRARYAPLFARHNVDVIITGHDHNYQLSRPIAHHYEKHQRQPYRHLISGGGGAGLYNVHDNDLWSYRAIRQHHWILCMIDGDRLEATVIGENGDTLDEFVIHKGSRPDDVVAYELIELHRMYQGLAMTDASGQPVPGLLLDPGQTRGEVHYRLHNPLPEPIRVSLHTGSWHGITFDPPRHNVSLSADETVVLACRFELQPGESPRPEENPRVQIESPVGQTTAVPLPPPLAVRPTLLAREAVADITVDGQDDEAIWKNAEPFTRLVTMAGNRLTRQDRQSATSVRAFHDRQKLYVLVQSVRPEDQKPQVGRSVDRSDAAGVYVAGPGGKLLVWMDSRGRQTIEGLREEAVSAAVHVDGSRVNWELAIPLEPIVADGGGEAVHFNVIERRGRETFSFSPTFGQPPARENSGRLTLENFAAAGGQAQR